MRPALPRRTHTAIAAISMSLLLLAACGSDEESADMDELTEFATRYAATWSGGDPEAHAAHYAEDGVLRINDGEPAIGREAVEEVVRGFMAGFPDMVVELVELRKKGDKVQFHWHWTGTYTGPGGNGAAVDMTGYEEWTFDDDGLILESHGNYDDAEYQRQLHVIPKASQQSLYRVTMLRAAPGRWVELKALIEGQGEAGSTSAEGRRIPYRMRHSQGAQWDFMLLQPVDSWDGYFSANIQQLESAFRSQVAALADFEEDWFISGPPHDAIKRAYPDAGMFLIEMFRARAGMKDELFDSRVRENAVLAAIEIPPNFVFTGQFGADWDVMTIGFYESFAAYGAAGVGVPSEQRDAAARANGYDGMGDLAPQLRTFLTQHSDTLASAMQ